MRTAVCAALLGLVLFASTQSARCTNHHFTQQTTIWSDDEMKACNGNFGVPNLVTTPSGTFVFGRCCAEDACVSLGEEGGLGDPMAGAYTVMKKAASDYSSWDDTTYKKVTEPNGPRGYIGTALYDFVRDRIFVLSRSYDASDPNNIRYYSMWTTDEGDHWTTLEVTDQIRPMAPQKGQYMGISAGSKVVLQDGPNKGRMLVNMRTGSLSRLVYTDDGGHTWNASNVYNANENSVTQCPIGQTQRQDGKTLYLVGRPEGSWKGKSDTSYWSYDSGHNVEPVGGEQSSLPTVGNNGCERSLVNAGNAIITCEPVDKHRSDMTCQCSKDCGRSWPYTIGMDGPGGYSDLTALPGGGVLMAYQAPKAKGKSDPHNMMSTVITGGWCH